MKIKSLFAVLCLLSFNAHAEGQYKIRWILAHQPTRVFERAAKYFSNEVNQQSKGKIHVEILGLDKKGNGQYLTPMQAFKKVQSGEVEMCQTYTTYLGTQNKTMWVLDLPYLFKDHDHATRVLDGAIGKRILASMDNTGVKALAFTYSGGYRIIPSNKKEITKVEDFKGMKVRITDSPVASAYLKELGATPIQVEDVDHYAKKADAFETTYARLGNIAGQKSQFINETEHSLFLTSVLMNKKFFESLPSDMQKIVSDAVLKTAKMEREDSIKDGAVSKEKYLKQGFKIVSLEKGEREKLVQKAEVIQNKFDSYFGDNLLRDIKNN